MSVLLEHNVSIIRTQCQCCQDMMLAWSEHGIGVVGTWYWYGWDAVSVLLGYSLSVARI